MRLPSKTLCGGGILCPCCHGDSKTRVSAKRIQVRFSPLPLCRLDDPRGLLAPRREATTLTACALSFFPIRFRISLLFLTLDLGRLNIRTWDSGGRIFLGWLFPLGRSNHRSYDVHMPSGNRDKVATDAGRCSGFFFIFTKLVQIPRLAR